MTAGLDPASSGEWDDPVGSDEGDDELGAGAAVVAVVLMASSTVALAYVALTLFASPSVFVTGLSVIVGFVVIPMAYLTVFFATKLV